MSEVRNELAKAPRQEEPTPDCMGKVSPKHFRRVRFGRPPDRHQRDAALANADLRAGSGSRLQQHEHGRHEDSSFRKQARKRPNASVEEQGRLIDMEDIAERLEVSLGDDFA
eukprot:s234_g32.t1